MKKGRKNRKKIKEKLPFWTFYIGIPLRKSSKTIPAPWDLLGERPFRRPSPVPSSGRPRRPTVPRRPALDLGGCASSRLDHGLKFYGIRGGCASSRLINGSPNPNNSKKCSKNNQKMRKIMRKTRQNHPNPGLTQKSKVPKWVCRSTLASNGPPFFAIFGPARGQVFEKRPKKS